MPNDVKHVIFFERTRYIYWLLSASLFFLISLFIVCFFRRKHGWRTLIRYVGRIFAANPKDTAICVVESMAPAFYTLGTVVLLKKMQAAYDREIGRKLSVSALHQGDALASALGYDSWANIQRKVVQDGDLPVWGWVLVLLCGLFLKIYLQFDFKKRIPGGGARRAAILSIVQTLITNADSEFLRANTPANLIDVFVGPALNIVNDGFISVFIIFRATASLVTIFIITYVYLSLPIFRAVTIFIGGWALLMSGCCRLSHGVPKIVREREVSHNRWLFFVSQILGILPTAQVSKSHDILLERLKVLLQAWTGKCRQLIIANTKTQLWPVFIEDLLYIAVVIGGLALVLLGQFQAVDQIALLTIIPRLGTAFSQWSSAYLKLSDAMVSLWILRTHLRLIQPKMRARELAVPPRICLRGLAAEMGMAENEGMFDSIELDTQQLQIDGAHGAVPVIVRDLCYPSARCTEANRLSIFERLSIPERRQSQDNLTKEEQDEDGRGTSAVLLLRNLNLTVEAGATVCVFASVGQRESCAALLDILAGLRRERNFTGDALIDGEPALFARESGRVIVAYVKEKPELVVGTVKDNLRLCNLDASDAELCEAARLACVAGVNGSNGGNGDDGEDDDVAGVWAGLINILSFEVGDNGCYLDIAARQRLCIARALVTKPDVLILEDPTHWQTEDETTAARIMENLSSLKCTVIYSTSQPRFVEFATHYTSFEPDGTLVDLRPRGADARNELLRRANKNQAAWKRSVQKQMLQLRLQDSDTEKALRGMYPTLSPLAQVVEQEQNTGHEVLGGLKRRIRRAVGSWNGGSPRARSSGSPRGGGSARGGGRPPATASSEGHARLGDMDVGGGGEDGESESKGQGEAGGAIELSLVTAQPEGGRAARRASVGL